MKELKHNVNFISCNIFEVHKNYSAYLIKQICFELISSKLYTDFDEIFDITFEDHELEKQLYIFFSKSCMQHVSLEC